MTTDKEGSRTCQASKACRLERCYLHLDLEPGLARLHLATSVAITLRWRAPAADGCGVDGGSPIFCPTLFYD